jgi:hypothetical protein
MEGDYLNIFNKSTGICSTDIIKCNDIPRLQYYEAEINVQITRLEHTLRGAIERKEFDDKKVISFQLAIRLQDILLTQICAKIMYLEAPLKRKIEALKKEVELRTFEANYWKGLLRSVVNDETMNRLFEKLDERKAEL